MSERSNSSTGSYTGTLPWRGLISRRRLRFKRIVFWAVAAVLSIVALQFAYPWNATLPFARVGETQLGMVGLGEAEAKLDSTYKDWHRSVKTANIEYPVAPGEIGLQVDTGQTAEAGLRYHWWQRLIPGSFLWRIIDPNVLPMLNTQPDVLRAFAEKVQQDNYRAYRNAAIKIEGDQASIVADVEGADYAAADTMEALSREFFLASQPLSLKFRVLDPVITKMRAQPALEDIQKLISAPPKYEIGSTQGEINGTLFGSWIIAAENETEKRLDVKLNSGAIEHYLSSLYPYVYDSPAGLVPGNNEFAVDVASAVSGFNGTLERKGEQVTVNVAQLAVTDELRATRDYSQSQLGLQTLINDIAAEKGDYAIAVQEIGGWQWAASVNGDKKYTPASTYKLFVAYSVLKKIEAGEWSWNDRMAGMNLEYCFDIMIINSDNICAEAFGNTIGWKNIENQMREFGLKDTVLNSGAFISTANDELLFMTKLGRSELLSRASRDKLIDVMKRQVYRLGIPAGTGVPVANKVGFLYGLLHDAALVYSPSGTYALVILTNNSSWADIADAASLIQAHLERATR